jgi:hypothetical protein
MQLWTLPRLLPEEMGRVELQCSQYPEEEAPLLVYFPVHLRLRLLLTENVASYASPPRHS